MRKLTWGDITLISIGSLFLIWAVRVFAAVILSEQFEVLQSPRFWGFVSCPLIAAALFLFTGFRGRVDIKRDDDIATDDPNKSDDGEFGPTHERY